MTYEEAKEKVKNFCVGCTDVTKCDDCEFPIIYKVLEKQIPKKPIRGYTCKANNDSWRSCPECHARQWDTHKYCSQCGQAIDWSENQ